jgi:hypothetical protein
MICYGVTTRLVNGQDYHDSSSTRGLTWTLDMALRSVALHAKIPHSTGNDTTKSGAGKSFWCIYMVELEFNRKSLRMVSWVVWAPTAAREKYEQFM